MKQAIRQFRGQIATARSWVVAAVIVAGGLSLYFAAQGVRYWQVAGNNSSVREDIGRLERATGQLPDHAAKQEARLEINTFRLDNLHRLYDYPAADTLMSIVSDTAATTGLDLVSMTADQVTIEPRGSLQYHVRPISVILDGPTANVQEFLALLYDRVPVVSASGARIVNLDATPSTQVRLRFYLSPEPIPEEGDETAG